MLGMVNVIAIFYTKTTFTHTSKVCVLIEKLVSYHLDVKVYI
jgi:hypothetical protein